MVRKFLMNLDSKSKGFRLGVNEDPFAGFPVVNHVPTWPDLRECFDTPSCSFQGLCPLYKM